MQKISPISLTNTPKNLKNFLKKNKPKKLNLDLTYEERGFYKVGDKFVKQIFTR